MPTLAALKDAIEARLADLWTEQIVPRQARFYSNRGRYWQGVISTALVSLPDNVAGASPVLEVAPSLVGHPTDQPDSWLAAGIDLGLTIPMALQIDAYRGVLGDGYVGIAWARWDGKLYNRAKAFGPEQWQTHDWVRVA